LQASVEPSSRKSGRVARRRSARQANDGSRNGASRTPRSWPPPNRDITRFGHLLFSAYHEDWANFLLSAEHPEAGEEVEGTQHDLQTATSELELIAPRPIRELAEALESGVREFDWMLTVARITTISPEELAVLSDRHESLSETRSRLADAMRADVNGMTKRPAL
jgi:hypothetical protein